MKRPTREAVLDRVALPKDRTVRQRARNGKALEQLPWDDLSLVIEGLALGQRPIRAAAHEITQRYDLGPRGAFILSLISGGIVYPLELALALKVSRSMVSGELVRLSGAGLISATQGTADKRRSELALTAAGEQANGAVREEMARILRRNLAGYSAEEVRLLGQMLRDVRQLADTETDED